MIELKTPKDFVYYSIYEMVCEKMGIKPEKANEEKIEYTENDLRKIVESSNTVKDSQLPQYNDCSDNPGYQMFRVKVVEIMKIKGFSPKNMQAFIDFYLTMEYGGRDTSKKPNLAYIKPEDYADFLEYLRYKCNAKDSASNE